MIWYIDIEVCRNPKFCESMKCKIHLYTNADPLQTYAHAQWEQDCYSDNHTFAEQHISASAEAYQEKMRKIERQLAR